MLYRELKEDHDRSYSGFCVYVCVICFLHLETGNYPQFAGGANLSSTMVLRLQDGAGATVEVPRCVHAPVFVASVRRLCSLCVRL